MPTTNLSLVYLVSAQSQPEVPLNGNWDLLDSLVFKKTGDSGNGNFIFSKAPDATVNYPAVAIGDGGFAGLANGFHGLSSSGTYLGINASGTTKPLLDLQINGTSALWLGAGNGGSLGVQSNSAATLSVSRRAAVAAPGLPIYFSVVTVADTALSAGTDTADVWINNAAVRQWATGALATQRFFRIDQPTISFAAASTCTDTGTVSVAGAPIAGTNATLTNSYALWVQAGGMRVQGHLFFGGGTAPTAVAGGNAGTTPPAPAIASGSSDTRGNVSFGTGTTPSAGPQVAVTFNTPYTTAPYVHIQPKNTNATFLNPAVTSVTTTGFSISAGSAPGASQANTAYPFDYWVVQ